MGGLTPKAPQAPEPSAQQEQLTDQLFQQLLGQEPFQFGPNVQGVLGGLLGGAGQGGQRLPGLLTDFALRQVGQAQTPFGEFFAPERRAINRGFARQGQQLAESGAARNILGSDFLQRQAGGLATQRQDVLSGARGRARGRQFQEFLGRTGVAGQALGLGQQIRGQQFGQQLGLLGAVSGLEAQQFGLQQQPFQQGLGLLGTVGGLQSQEFQNLLQQFQAQQQANAPFGELLGLGGSFLLGGGGFG